MPVEIRELVIKATVTSEVTGNANVRNYSKDNPALDNVVQDCVNKVLEILKEKNER